MSQFESRRVVSSSVRFDIKFLTIMPSRSVIWRRINQRRRGPWFWIFVSWSASSLRNLCESDLYRARYMDRLASAWLFALKSMFVNVRSFIDFRISKSSLSGGEKRAGFTGYLLHYLYTDVDDWTLTRWISFSFSTIVNHRTPPILLSVWWSFSLQYDPNLWANLSRGECFEVAEKGLSFILCPYDVQTHIRSTYSPQSLIN